jgi:hypothetical protein
MLTRYLDRLHARGIGGYSQDDLEAGYWLMLLMLLSCPARDATNGSGPAY